ncbi:hypothetical protein GCM10011487_21900 [Steroidobacter agaridevorans]|uniref:Uncharacterized protein n=1 Tax=Steroidobacter agaridevorans TaxID=2695856 RepID=A0A829YAI1_9GAMM|nr:hypothetical protein GCM10011487_21900 [Steroidobacter agaridevorans]GFE89840.1 hypothetical protein GCM10011488_47940 [Steroidobacter agaridevorans]
MRKALVAALCTLWAGATSAEIIVTSTIAALQIYPASNGGYVKLTGHPTISYDLCSGEYGYGDLNDEKFMIYIWPALLLAHSKGRTVKIGFSGGCGPGAAPRIAWVEVNAGTP